MPERSCTSHISKIVQYFCQKVLFLLWIERHTIIKVVGQSAYRHTHTHRKMAPTAMTSTADAGGKNALHVVNVMCGNMFQ